MPVYIPAIVGDEFLGVWTGGPAQATMRSSITTTAGMCFELPVTLATGRDIALDPPTFTSLVFEVWHQWPPLPGLRSMVLSIIDTPNPPRFDNAGNRPSDQVALYGSRLLHSSEVFPDPTWMAWYYMPIDLDEVFPVYRNSGWQGRLNLILNYWAHSNPPLFHTLEGLGGTREPRLVSEEVPYITGISGPVDAQSRVDRCGKCGKLDVREHFRQDGYSKGLWVCEECWDPEEPPEQAIPPDRPPIND